MLTVRINDALRSLMRHNVPRRSAQVPAYRDISKAYVLRMLALSRIDLALEDGVMSCFASALGHLSPLGDPPRYSNLGQKPCEHVVECITGSTNGHMFPICGGIVVLNCILEL